MDCKEFLFHLTVFDDSKCEFEVWTKAVRNWNCFLSRSGNFILVVGVFFFAAQAVQALDPNKAVTQYIHDEWTTRDGLPQDTISSIIQDGEGYIWLATQEGLVRFDGVNFTVFDSSNTDALKENVIYVVFVDSKGELWIGASDGLLHYRNGAFEFFGGENGLPPNNVAKSISEDSEGNLWLGYSAGDKKNGEAGLGRLKDGCGAIFTVDDGLPANQIKKTFADKKGNLWIATAHGLSKLRDGRFINYTTEDGVSDNLVRTVTGDRAGNLWVGTMNGLNRYNEGKFTAFTTKDGLSDNGIRAVFEDKDGIIWVGTDKGLNRIVGGKIEAVKGIEPFEKDEIISFLEDAEGSLWIGTRARGLHRLRDGKFTVFGSTEGVLGDNVNAIFEDRDGHVLIGTNPGGLSILRDGLFMTYSTTDGLLSNKVQMIAQDREGAFWLGTRYGLNRFKEGKFAAYRVQDGLPDESVRSFYQSHDGSVWIGTNGGLNRIRDGKFVSIPGYDKFVGKSVAVIFEDRQGRIWVGMDEDTGYFAAGDEFAVYPEEDLNKANVQAIFEDDEGVLWFATWGQGLIRLKNDKLTVFTSKEGLFDNTQWSVLDDSEGNLWMGSNRGIFRVSKRELDDFAEGRIEKINPVIYGAAEGMRKSENNLGGLSAIKTRDGRLWFSTTAGAAVIDPKNIPVNRIEPPVVVERVLIDENLIAAKDTPIIPPGVSGIEFRYAGLSFIQPAKMKFRYKLQGFDPDWVDAGTRRAAFYTNLPPGEYEFLVTAANSDGIWNERGASFRFRVQAPFWRTPWFYGMSILGIAGIAFLFYRWRITKLEGEKIAQQKFSQQLIESQERERKRIAVELHDGLGQNLIVIKNRALIGLNERENHEKVLAQMEEISASISASISEVRGIARNLHPYQIEYLGLQGALKAMIKAAADASNIEFVAEIDKLAGLFSKELEINLYRIVQEAVNNIIKHSGATQAVVSVRLNVPTLELLISDNGRGFPASDATNQNRGLGLIGMSERANMLNASYDIISSENGTTIKLQINLPTQKNEK